MEVFAITIFIIVWAFEDDMRYFLRKNSHDCYQSENNKLDDDNPPDETS